MADNRTEPLGVSKAPACKLVIFGASGDLTKRLLAPALYNLAGSNLLPDEFSLFGVDLGSSIDEWKQLLDETMHSFTKDSAAEFYTPEIDQNQWAWVKNRLNYLQGDFNQTETFRLISDAIGESCAIFYLAVAAQFFGPIVEGLGEAGLLKQSDGRFRRLIIEKPFGTDVPSAQALNAQVGRHADESQTYRIDHFLGKEAVQDILAIRFANKLFESTWHREYIDHVQITVAETVGVEKRGRFYEATGALRDMIPNHLLTLLCMVAMEPPDSSDPEAIRDERAKLIRSVLPLHREEAVRGQYQAGRDNGGELTAYREEPDVAPDSNTETYIALKVSIENSRWAEVPFYLRTGKRLSKRQTVVSVHYKPVVNGLFRETTANDLTPNVVRFLIDPDQGIETQFSAKIPGPKVKLGRVQTSACLKDFFEEKPSVGYETLLYACMVGDTTLFHRADAIELSWAIVQPVLEAWGRGEGEVDLYPAGSQGPVSANTLLEVDGRHWLPLD